MERKMGWLGLIGGNTLVYAIAESHVIITPAEPPSAVGSES